MARTLLPTVDRMKNQYFGDERDYLKYSLVRLLTSNGELPTAVCWLLTEDDGGQDGRKLGYLLVPERWRKYDPKVYDYLRRKVVDEGMRDVRVLEQDILLSGCTFFSEIVPVPREAREDYLNRFLGIAGEPKLVFFDPDNGVEVASVPLGRRRAEKYVYQEELQESFSRCHSLLIYQHFPHRPRLQFVQEQTCSLRDLLGANAVFTFHNSEVAFFLVAQSDHETHFSAAYEKIKDAWKGAWGKGRGICLHGPMHQSGECVYDRRRS